MRTLYFVLEESHIRYDINGWGGTLETYVVSLEVIQNQFLKLIYKKNKRSNLYAELNNLNMRKLTSSVAVHHIITQLDINQVCRHICVQHDRVIYMLHF